MWGPVQKKIVGPQDQNERPNVLFNFGQLLKLENASRPDKDILSKVTLL